MALETLNIDSTVAPATSQATTPQVVGKALTGKNSSYGLPIAGAATGVDPGLLENMQKLINEREAQKNSMYAALQEASAWGSGGVNGPGQALLARQKQQEEEDATTFSMKSQLAQAKMAQQVAQNDAAFVQKALAGTGGGGGGYGAGAQYSPEAMTAAQNARTPAEARAILQKDLESRGSARNKGLFEAAGNKPEKYFWPGKGEVTMTPNMLVNMPAELRKQIETETYKMLGYVPGAAPTGAAPTGKAVEIATGLGIPLISGNRDNQKQAQLYAASQQPGYKGPPVAAPGRSQHQFGNAIDVGNITEAQKAQLRQAGFTQPVANDPNHWELGRTPMATAPAAVAKLDTPMADNFPVVAGEENQAVQRFTPPEGLPKISPPAAISAPSFNAPAQAAPKQAIAVPEFNEPPPQSKDFQSQGAYETAKQTWERKRDAAIKIQEERMIAEAKVPSQAAAEFGTGTEKLNAAKAAKIDTSGLTAPERSVRFKDIIAVTEDPAMKTIFGKLAKRGLSPFVLKQLESGVNAGQFGTIGVANLERNLMEAGATPKQIEQLRRVEKHLAAAELEYAQTYLTGQGAVSDNERKLVKDAVGSIKDPARVLGIQAKVMAQRADFDSKIYDAYNSYRDSQGEYASFGKFMRSPEARKIITEHNTNLAGIIGRSPSELNDPIKAGAAPQAEQHPGKSLVDQYLKKGK